MITVALLQAVDRSDGQVRDPDRQQQLVALFAAEGRALVRLARIFTDDKAAAEDLVQEAFIRLYRSAHRIRESGREAAYLRSIVLNLCRDHNRRGLMSLRHSESSSSEQTAPGADDVAVRNERQAEVIDALHALSTRQKQCLVLRFYLEYSEREIADTLGISPNSVKTHCRRGLAVMRTSLGEGL